MLKTKLEEALAAAQAEGNDAIVSLIEQALAALDGGVSTSAASGGGGHGVPPGN